MRFFPKPVMKVDNRELNEALFRFQEETHKAWPQVLRPRARSVAVSLAIQTQPFGSGPEPQKTGINAVRRDIGKVYACLDTVYDEIKAADRLGMAMGFYAAVKNGNLDRAQTILRHSKSPNRNTPIGAFDKGAAHRSSRNSRGRVSRRRPALVVSNFERVGPYIKRVERLVGFAKGGWAACARALGGVRGINAGWVTRQKSPGEVIENYSFGAAKITLKNNVRYIDKAISEAQIQEALRIEQEKMEKYIEIRIAKAAERARLRAEKKAAAAAGGE